MIASLLSGLESGAAFVPPDPEQPEIRIRLMLRDAQPSVVLTSANLRPRVPDGPWAIIDRRAPRCASSGSHRGSSSQLACYVGNHGRAERIDPEHRAVVNRLLWMQAIDPIDATDAVLEKASIGFTSRCRRSFWPLMAGSATLLAAPGHQRDPANTSMTQCGA